MWNKEHSGTCGKFKCFGSNNLHGMVLWLLKWKHFLRDEDCSSTEISEFFREADRQQPSEAPSTSATKICLISQSVALLFKLFN